MSKATRIKDPHLHFTHRPFSLMTDELLHIDMLPNELLDQVDLVTIIFGQQGFDVSIWVAA